MDYKIVWKHDSSFCMMKSCMLCEREKEKRKDVKAQTVEDQKHKILCDILAEIRGITMCLNHLERTQADAYEMLQRITVSLKDRSTSQKNVNENENPEHNL